MEASDDWKRRSDDVLSKLGPTKAFLEARGLTHVRELGEKGRSELKAHLEAEAERLKTP